MKLLVVFAALVAFTAACSDKSSYCRFFPRAQCSTNAIVRMQCPKYCGTCGGSGSGSSGSCRDLSSNCYMFRSQCSNSYVRQRCPKTCNACSGGGSGGSGGSGVPSCAGKGTGLPSGAPCGQVKVSSSRVIAGENAKAGAWPWQIAMTMKNGRFFCGGSLVNAKWVVTASHCIDKQQASNIQIVLGGHDLNHPSGSEQTRNVKRLIMHPSYGRLNNDIALIELDRPVMFTDRIQPVCLPEPTEQPAVGSKCYLTGWGKIQHPGSSHPILQQVGLTIQENSQCNRLNSKYVPISQQMVCAANPGTRQMGCHGDSGGPLVCQQPDGSFKLHGGVSWGSPTCTASDAWTVFARVSVFRNWLNCYINN